MENQNPEQSAPQNSLEDRIANVFDNTPDEPKEQETAPIEADAEQVDTQAEAETTEPETFEVEVEGEKFALPKKLEKAVMQERDYTQKSQKLAEERRTIEHMQAQYRVAAMTEQFQKSVANEVQQLAMLDAVIKQRQSIDWANVPNEDLMRARMELDQFKDRKGELERLISDKQQQFQQQVQAEAKSIQEKAMEIVKQKIPGWSEATAKEVREHALSLGFTNDELSSINDPRHVEVLYKARMYDKLRSQAKPAATQAKSIKTSPVKQMPQRVKEELNFRKTMANLKPGMNGYEAAVKARIAQKFS